MQYFVHYGLHLLFPLGIAIVFFRKEWKRVYLIFLATMLVDLDHLFADPIFQANRCSIQFHPLHTYWAMAFYFVLVFLKTPYRWMGIGLLLHMLTDTIDCVWTFHQCTPCLQDAPAEPLVRFIHGVIF